MTDDNTKCKLCGDLLISEENSPSYKDMIWHEKCLLAEIASDYLKRRYGD